MYILNKVLFTKMMTQFLILLLFFFVFSAHATSVALPYTFTAGSPISASQMMGNFSSITSALSSTVSSPWVASSSNIYFNTGSVGIGSSAPVYKLDVNGSVNATSFVGSGSGIQLPFFLVTCNSAQSFAANTWIPVNYNYAIKDTLNAFNTATSQYKPQIAGYYSVRASLLALTSNLANTATFFVIYKNGSEFGGGPGMYSGIADSSGRVSMHAAGTVYLNGSSDYIDVRVYFAQAATIYSVGLYLQYQEFSGHLIYAGGP